MNSELAKTNAVLTTVSRESLAPQEKGQTREETRRLARAYKS